MIKRKTHQPSTEKAKYQPTAREQAVIDRNVARRATETLAPRLKVIKRDERKIIWLDHPEVTVGYELLIDALGTIDVDFVCGLVQQLTNAGKNGDQIDEVKINFMLSIIKGIKPNDQMEAMLAAQMAAVHMATLTFARALDHSETIDQQDSAERAFNKLARTFAMQLEALKRYRTGGEQKVTVQHVSVSEGGQAIVGNVTHTAHETATEKSTNSTSALTDAQKPAMTIIDKPERAQVALRRKKKDDA